MTVYSILHPPHCNGMFLKTLLYDKSFFLPGFFYAAVKDDQMSFIGSAPVHILPGLFQAGIDGFLHAFIENFQFDYHPLNFNRITDGGRLTADVFYYLLFVIHVLFFNRPYHQQIRTHPAQPILPLYPSAAIYDPLQKRLNQQLGSGFLVVEALDPVLRRLPT